MNTAPYTHKSTYSKFIKKILSNHKSDTLEQKLTKLSSVDGSLWKETTKLLKFKVPFKET